jgi:hypothetical protein
MPSIALCNGQIKLLETTEKEVQDTSPTVCLGVPPQIIHLIPP